MLLMKKDQQNIFTPCISYLKVKLELSSDRESGAKYAEWAKMAGSPFAKATKLTYQWSQTGSINFMKHMEYVPLQPVTTKNSQKTFKPHGRIRV